MISYLISLGQTYFVVFISSTIKIKDLKELEKQITGKSSQDVVQMGFLQTQSDLETELPSEQNLTPAKFPKYMTANVYPFLHTWL